MDYWQFPIGTQIFKEFAVVPQIGARLRVETRWMTRFGPGVDDWLFATYKWNEAGTEATLNAGEDDVLGTDHDIPSESQCKTCHGGLGQFSGGTPSRVNGIGAIQLSYDAASTLDLADLISEGWLSAPPAGDIPVPSATW